MKKYFFWFIICFIFITAFWALFKSPNIIIDYYRFCQISKENNHTPPFNKILSLKPILIAHAGGAFKGEPYTNTMEAFENSYTKGFVYYEADFNASLDNHFVCIHDWEATSVRMYSEPGRLSKAAFLSKKTVFGTLISMETLIDWVIKNRVFLITDGKEANLRLLADMMQYSDSVKKYVIPQTYNFKEIYQVKKMGFEKVIFTNYVKNYPLWMLNTIWKSGLVWGITIPISTKNLLTYKLLLNKNIRLFMHTINDQKIANKLFEDGVDGFYTDTLSP